MAKLTSVRSRAFLVTSSLVMATAYLATAVGLWMVNQGRIDTSADSLNPTCTPAVVTDNFEGPQIGFSLAKVGGGLDVRYERPMTRSIWPVDIGKTDQILIVETSPSSTGSIGPANYTMSRSIQSVNEGSFKFDSVAAFISNNPYGPGAAPAPLAITVNGSAGKMIEVKIKQASASGSEIPISISYETGSSAPVTISDDRIREAGAGNPVVGWYTFEIKWYGSTFDLFLAGKKLTPNAVSYSYLDRVGSATGLQISGASTQVNPVSPDGSSQRYIMNAFDNMAYPGSTKPCIISVNPSTTAPDTNATLTGTNFLPGTIVNFGNGKTAPLTDINAQGTSGVFHVPADLAAGTYNIFVTNSNGQSGTVPFTIAVNKFSVTGLVFEDANGDGLVDDDETKRPGEAVKLSLDVAPYTAITTATTTSNGAYAFNDLAPGRYRVTYGSPSGYVRTTDDSRPFDLGPSLIHNFGIRKAAITLAGTGLICSTDEQRRQMTEDFELFADGQAKDFGWFVTAGGNASAIIKKDQGKSGNGLVLTDTNSANLSDAFVQVSKPIPGTEAGSVAFDLKPTVANGAFTLSLASEKGETIVLGIKGDGVLYKQPTNTDAQAIVSLGAIKLNEFNRIGIAWTKDTVEVTINGTKFSKEVLKYNVPANAGPITNVALATGSGDAGVGEAGSFVVDNLEFPGCGNVLTLSVSPKTGNVPLEVTAVAGLPFKNLLNEPYTFGTDVDSAPTDLVVGRNKDTGALELPDIPTTTGSCTAKSWLYDLDQNKVNQLLWKRPIPENATVEAKISWATPDTSGKKGALLGGIGFIDKDSLFHQWVGIRDESTTEGKFGVVAASVRDGQKQTIDCAATTINYPEVTSVLPKGDTAFTPTRETFVSSQGTALLKLVRRGNKVKVFVDNEFVKEQTTAGDVAGIALGVAGLKDAEFGTLTLESLKLTNDSVGWDFGDKIQGRCIASEKCEMPQTQGDTGTTVKHTYTSAGKFVVTVTNGGEEARSDAQSASTQVDVAPPPTGGGNPPTTPPDTRIDNSQNGPPPTAAATKPASLVSTGGNLYVNLGIALLLSIGTAYILLRRRHPDSSN